VPAGAALAGDPGCATVELQASAGLRARWPRLAGSVRDALAARDDIDRCARVTLGLGAKDASLTVAVILPDGRSAARAMERPEDVVPALAALLLIPEGAPPLPGTEPSDPPSGEPPPGAPHPAGSGVAGASASTIRRDAPAPRPAAAPLTPPDGGRGGLNVELAVAMSGRFGDGQVGAAIGAVSFLEVSGWLAGFEGRVDGYQRDAAGGPNGALELALLGGRRFRSDSGSVTLDLTAGAALALQGSSKSVKEVGSTSPPMTTNTSRAEARARAGARLNLRASSALRPFVALDGDFGRARAANEIENDLLPLPAWTLGVAFGAAVGTR
jgi:hypothetical protein